LETTNELGTRTSYNLKEKQRNVRSELHKEPKRPTEISQNTATTSSSQKQTDIINKIEKLFQMLEREHLQQKTEIDDVDSNKKLELAGSKCNFLEQGLSAGETEGSNENLSVKNYQLDCDEEERYCKEDQNPENYEEQSQFANPDSENTPSVAGSNESEHTIDKPELENVYNREYGSDEPVQDTESIAEEGSVDQSKNGENPNQKFMNELANAKSLITTLIQDKISELENGVVQFGDMSGGDTKIAANFMAVQNMHVCKSSDEIRHLKQMRKQCLEDMAGLVDRMTQLDTTMEKCEKCLINYQ
jgi:hypothetical protein